MEFEQSYSPVAVAQTKVIHGLCTPTRKRESKHSCRAQPNVRLAGRRAANGARLKPDVSHRRRERKYVRHPVSAEA